MAETVQLALAQWQMRPLANFRALAAQARALLNQADGADLVVFPETFTFSLLSAQSGWQQCTACDLTRVAQYTDSYRDFFSTEASRRGQHIAAGSHLVLRGGRYFNVGHVFVPDGTMRTHAKTHIFPGEAEWLTAEGDDLAVWDFGFAKVGMMICYEAEIPECATTLRDMGAEILICPSYTFSEYGFWRVRYSCHARAIENQVYVAHCCTAGSPGGPVPPGFGRSSVLTPCDVPWNAEGVAVEAEANVEGVVRALVSLDALRANRDTGAAPTHRDRRRHAEVYQRWAARACHGESASGSPTGAASHVAP